MRLKKITFAAIATIITLSVSTVAFSVPDRYLVPVEMKKADRTLIEGYIVLDGEEVYRMGAWISGRGLKKPRRRGEWLSQGKRSRNQSSIPPMLDFESIGFREGGHEVAITYGRGKEPVNASNFLSGNRIRFTTNPRNPTVLPEVFPAGQVLWIKRTGKARKIR
jgi:hypothetical protein